jgi:hypothetical protein
MASLIKSFRDFILKDFSENSKYEFLRPNYFKIFHEMARFGDIRNEYPIKIDKEDINFLKQFPHDYWKNAIKARYDMLFKAVERLHNHRQEDHKEGEIIDEIYQGIKEKNFDSIKKYFLDKEEFNHLTSTKGLSDNQIMEKAKQIAHYYVKQKTPHLLEDPNEEVEFSLNSSDKKVGVKKVTKFRAKPYLNRLYHKLETTHGEDFHPESGLPSGKGLYGFDMTNPISDEYEDNDEEDKDPTRTTQGMNFPKNQVIQSALRDFLNANSHRMFGDLPKDVVWQEVNGFEDTFTVSRAKEIILNQELLKLEHDPEYAKNITKRKKKAEEITDIKLKQMIKSGELKGPPIPGVNEDGFSPTIEGGKIKNPPLYLPFEKRILHENGNLVEKMVPIVNPAHYLRELGKEKNDFITDPQTGQRIINVPKEKLRGHNKQFVKVNDEEFQGTRHESPGSMSINKSSERSTKVTPADPQYNELYEKIINSQRRGGIDSKNNFEPGKGDYLEDIIMGIRQCLKHGCGGATNHEIEILRSEIEDFHQLVFMKMIADLGNKKLLDAAGRRDFARNKIGVVLQKDLSGGGTRRTRILGQIQKTQYFSGGGEEKNITAEIESRTKEGPASLYGSSSEEKRKKGQKILDTSGRNFPYDLQNLRSSLSSIRKDAKMTDEINTAAKQTVAQSTDAEKNADIYELGLHDKIIFQVKLKNTLAELIQQKTGTSQEQADNTAQKTIISWIKEGNKTSESLLQAFEKHPLVVQAKESEGIITMQKNPKEQEALDSLERFLDLVEKQNMEESQIEKIAKPKTGEKYSKAALGIAAQINASNDESILSLLQKEIDKKFGFSQKPEEIKKAARIITPKPTLSVPTIPMNNGNFAEQKAKGDYVGIAHNSLWLYDKTTNPKSLNNLLQWFEAKIKLTQNEEEMKQYQSSIQNIQKALKERGD